MEKFSLARITSDEIQDELTELGPRYRSPEPSKDTMLGYNTYIIDSSELNYNQKRSQDQKLENQSENKIVKSQDEKVKHESANKVIEAPKQSKSNLNEKPSNTENMKKSKSKLLQSFERLKSLTKLRSRNSMKTSKLEISSPKTKSKETEAVYNTQTSNIVQVSNNKQTSSNVQRAESPRKKSIIKVGTDEHTKKSSVKLSISQDKAVQYDNICVQYKCPLDCKNILIAQEQEATEKEKQPNEKVPEGGQPKAKTPTKKRYYLIRSKTRDKIKSKNLSDLSDSQKQKIKEEETRKQEEKNKDAATKIEPRKKCCSKRSTSSQSSKKKKKTPPSTPKRSKSPKRKKKCYGHAQTQTAKQEKPDLTEEQKLEEKQEAQGKDDKTNEEVPVGKDDKKAKDKKKTKKCYYYHKRSKVDKKSEIPPVQPVLPTASSPLSPPRPVSSIQPSEKEEVTPVTDISTVSIIPSHETFPSSSVTIPTISGTTIPTVSRESVSDAESDKQTPYTSRSELYSTSDEVQEEDEKDRVEEEHSAEKIKVTTPEKRPSCLMAGPPAFVCNENIKFPEYRKRLNFSQNRGPIPPCLQPVLGSCEGRRCTLVKGGEKEQVCGVKYATVKITFFPEYTTYEVMRPSEKPPKCIPKCIEEVFVTKYEPKTEFKIQ